MHSPIQKDNSYSVEAYAQRMARCSQAAARALIPERAAQSLCVLPLAFTATGGRKFLLVACPRKLQPVAKQGLRLVSDQEVTFVDQPQALLEQAIPLAYALDGGKLLASARALQITHGIAYDIPRASGEPALFVEQLLAFAISQRASDIHLDPQADGVHVRLRIQGKLLEHGCALFELGAYAPICSRIKVLARLDVTQRNQPQDGSFSSEVFGVLRSMRVSIIPTLRAEKVVLRLQSSERAHAFEQLGFAAEDQLRLRELLFGDDGLLVVSGPTGSGKTTTLYALLGVLSGHGLNILSVEDPVERELPGVNQVPVNTPGGLSLQNCLRSVLRQDPDVIMIGEIRDSESAVLAAQAALTGHLVLTSVHAGSIEQARARLLQLGIGAQELSLALKAIVVQCLVATGDARTLETHCWYAEPAGVLSGAD